MADHHSVYVVYLRDPKGDGRAGYHLAWLMARAGDGPKLVVTDSVSEALALESNRITIEADPAAGIGDVLLRGPLGQCQRGRAISSTAERERYSLASSQFAEPSLPYM